MSDFPTAPADRADPAPPLVPCPRCTVEVADLNGHLLTCPEPAPADPADTAQEEAAYQARVADARALLAEDEQRRMTACLAEIEDACARHGMSLDIEPARLVLRPAN